MNKKNVNWLLILVTFFIIILCFKNNEILAISMQESSQIFLVKVFPFLFIMMILNGILSMSNFPYYVSKIIPNPYLYIFIVSALSGSPVNAVIINDFLEKKIITNKEASLSLCFSTLNNPLFLYNYFNIIFKNHLITSKMLLTIYFSNIIIMLFIIIRYRSNHKWNLQYIKYDKKKELIKYVTSSFNNLLNIFAIITFFKLICDILMPHNNALTILLKGFLEITQGLNLLCSILLSRKIKELLALVILSFSGLSIHMQIANILSKYNINYKYFYYSRLFLALLGIISIFLL